MDSSLNNSLLQLKKIINNSLHITTFMAMNDWLQLFIVLNNRDIRWTSTCRKEHYSLITIADGQQRYMHNMTNKGADPSSRYMHKTINIYLHQSICNSTTTGLHQYCYPTATQLASSRNIPSRTGGTEAARTTTDGGRADGGRLRVQRQTDAARTTTEARGRGGDDHRGTRD